MKYILIGAALLTLLSGAAAGFLYWQNGKLRESIGELEHSNAQMKNALAEKEKANKSRASTNQAVRKMAPAEKLERLK